MSLRLLRLLTTVGSFQIDQFKDISRCNLETEEGMIPVGRIFLGAMEQIPAAVPVNYFVTQQLPGNARLKQEV